MPAPRPKPKPPAKGNIHVNPFPQQEIVNRGSARVHTIFDVKAGKNLAIRGKGLRGPNAQEMEKLFGVKKKPKARPAARAGTP
jgi:hypothetical protein